jgi:hypothetical protein
MNEANCAASIWYRKVRQLGAYEFLCRDLVSHFLGQGIYHGSSLAFRDSRLLPLLG